MVSEKKRAYWMAFSVSERIRHGLEETYTLEEVEAMLKAREHNKI